MAYLEDKLHEGEREKMSDDDYKRYRTHLIKSRLSELSEDFAQSFAGAYIADLESRKKEFAELHNELRLILGKEERIYY